ncbi:unnamed protein product [Calypogeia fissa]
MTTRWQHFHSWRRKCTRETSTLQAKSLNPIDSSSTDLPLQTKVADEVWSSSVGFKIELQNRSKGLSLHRILIHSIPRGDAYLSLTPH